MEEDDFSFLMPSVGSREFVSVDALSNGTLAIEILSGEDNGVIAGVTVHGATFRAALEKIMEQAEAAS